VACSAVQVHASYNGNLIGISEIEVQRIQKRR
jgi:hypothetical protein